MNNDQVYFKKNNVAFEFRHAKNTAQHRRFKAFIVLHDLTRGVWKHRSLTSLTGMTEDELKRNLMGEIFKIPHTENDYQTVSEYLSDDIRIKLREMEEIAKYDTDFNIKVKEYQFPLFYKGK